MSDKIVIDGVGAGIDGEYDFDLAHSFTGREVHVIKHIAGVRLLEIQDALTSGDHDMFLALGMIALTRHGKTFTDDQFWDAPAGCVTYVAAETAEGDARPPDVQPDAGKTSSGDGSSSDGDASPTSNHPNGSGSPHSATTAISAPPI